MNIASVRRGRHEERRPRPFIASSGLWVWVGLSVCPGSAFVVPDFVVPDVVAEAAVQDADGPVAKRA